MFEFPKFKLDLIECRNTNKFCAANFCCCWKECLRYTHTVSSEMLFRDDGSVYAPNKFFETNKQQQKGKRKRTSSRQSMDSSIHVLNHQTWFDCLFFFFQSFVNTKGTNTYLKIYTFYQDIRKDTYPMRVQTIRFQTTGCCCLHRIFSFISLAVVVFIFFSLSTILLSFQYFFLSVSILNVGFTCVCACMYVFSRVFSDVFNYNFTAAVVVVVVVVDLVRLVIICSFQRSFFFWFIYNAHSFVIIKVVCFV